MLCRNVLVLFTMRKTAILCYCACYERKVKTYCIVVGQGYCDYMLCVAKLYSESLIEGGSVISLKTSYGGKNVVGPGQPG